MPDRRAALKIIGAIGSTCAFPFASDELYGQHIHPAPGDAAGYGPPKFFTPDEFALLAHLTDLIIPATDTPGASQVGVPSYIDYVAGSHPEWQKLYREGFAWLSERHFAQLTAQQQIDLLTPWVDREGGELPARFLRALKGMTADGYYTSKAGLVDELGYAGNTARESFPGCAVPEH